MTDKSYSKIIQELKNCQKTVDTKQHERDIINLAKSFYSEDYDKLYQLIYQLFKVKEYEIDNILLKEMIDKCPYYQNPDIYWMQLEIYDYIYANGSKINKYYSEEELIKKYIASHYLNVKDEVVGNYAETYIVCCKLNVEGLPKQDSWIAIGFLKRLIDADLRNKVYRFGGDSIPSFAAVLAEIYSTFEGSESKNYQKYSTMNSLYNYLGKLYNDDFDENETEEVIEKCLLSMVEKCPKDPMAYYAMGLFYNDCRDALDEAMRYLKNAAQLGIDEWRAYFVLGKIYCSKKSYETGEGFFIKALQIYDEHDINNLIEEVKDELSPVNGGKIDYETVKNNYELKNINEFLGSKDKALNSEIGIIGREQDISKKVTESLTSIFGDLYQKLHPFTRKRLEEAEKVYLEHPGDKTYERQCINYYYALSCEIWNKVFKPFRDNFRGKYQVDYLTNMKSLNVLDGFFYRYIDNTSFMPLGGQMINFLNNENLKTHPIYQSFYEYIKIVAPVLTDRSFIDEIGELAVERNKDTHPKDYGDSNVHYKFVRSAVLGTPKREGLIVRLIKSLEGC